jgi:hypothetical protein
MKYIINILVFIFLLGIFSSCNSHLKDIQRKPGKYYNNSKNFKEISKKLKSVRKYKTE